MFQGKVRERVMQGEKQAASVEREEQHETPIAQICDLFFLWLHLQFIGPD
jgi:hypothetical protein